MRQWMLKITDYAERLLRDLDGLDWPEGTKVLQRNWIGRSEGLEGSFEIEGHAGTKVDIFTTRPDTIFGVTFMVLAPEHPLVAKLTTADCASRVEAYRVQASRMSEIARQDQSKEKTGTFTGAYALHPFTGARIPLWIADYVMMGYGTGAIMAVPGHDERDRAFAEAHGLPVVQVIGEDGNALQDPVNAFIAGMPSDQAKFEVIRRAKDQGFGKHSVQYKLRDWLFSRQRYWGEPIPVLHSTDGASIPLKTSELPLSLPEVKSYEPTGTGESPLAAMTSWVQAREGFRRETDTMPGSAGSSWYFLRYIDPRNTEQFCDPELEKHWMPVDLYLGGDEHAVGHLLYTRFWMKVLHDAGLVSHDEPFRKLVHQGMILGEDGEKMSKSRGNVINPDDIVDRYGADTLRLYEMFMGPLEKDKPWSTQAIEGVYRFASRAWRLWVDGQADPNQAPTGEDLKVLHQTIRKVSDDIEHLRFNTAISAMMVFVNHFTKTGTRPRACLLPFTQLLAPFVPHLAEELWERMHEGLPTQKPELTFAPWPVFDPKYATEDEVTVAIQVLGKTRGTVSVAAGADQATVEAAAREIGTVAAQLNGKQVVKVIFVRDKILNFVVR